MKNFSAHILVVDDDDGIRNLVKQYLDKYNYEIFCGYFSVPYSAKAGNFFEDARCLNPQCRHHFVEYGKEQNVFKNTPEEFKKFIDISCCTRNKNNG